MAISDEIERLDQLRRSGALSETEFAHAKQMVLDGKLRADPDPDQSLGRAANRYVSYQMIMGVVGVVLFLILLFVVFLPNFRGRNRDLAPEFQVMPSGPGSR